MNKYRKKPVVIEAVHWTGDNWEEVYDFIYPTVVESHAMAHECSPQGLVVIHTLEGDMRASPNDWIIRGIRGELYPCKPDIFHLTYEQVDDSVKTTYAEASEVPCQ